MCALCLYVCTYICSFTYVYMYICCFSVFFLHLPVLFSRSSCMYIWNLACVLSASPHGPKVPQHIFAGIEEHIGGPRKGPRRSRGKQARLVKGVAGDADELLKVSSACHPSLNISVPPLFIPSRPSRQTSIFATPHRKSDEDKICHKKSRSVPKNANPMKFDRKS